jgi:RimJ/RimL family protein N-acetyltransferase
MNLQPTLQNELVTAVPLQKIDFEALFAAASDPKIWEQHPNKNRYRLPDFTNYFDGAIESGGAFLIKDTATNTVIGSTRYSDYLEENNIKKISIGYTFFTTNCWGKGFNHSLKRLMLDHIFQYVDQVLFYIGANNKRSQISIERLGAQKIAEEEIAYYGEGIQLNFVYAINNPNK